MARQCEECQRFRSLDDMYEDGLCLHCAGELTVWVNDKGIMFGGGRVGLFGYPVIGAILEPAEEGRQD